MQPRPLACRIAAATVVLSGAVILSISPTLTARAQDKPLAPDGPAATAQRGKAPSSKSPNVKNGDIVAFDAAADTLMLRDHAGKSAVYVVTPKTHYNRNRHATQRSDFKIGDSVVLHFRKSRTDGALLVSELDDPASWTWISGLRKTTTAAVVKVITDDTLSVTVGSDNLPLDYTISDKTRWDKAGKEVDASAFKPGDHVYVVPRSLPSGSIMARAVADSTSGAAQEKERLALSVHGTITSIDMAAHKCVLKTVAGDTRTLAFSDALEIVASGKTLPQTALKSGLHVAARIRHEAGGDEVIWRITIESLRKPSVPKKRAPAGKGVVTAH